MANKSSTGKYPIRTVARLTGIGLDTLRAWERRYDAVSPTRDERGRMYTDGDVQRLRLLRKVVERGHTIGRATKLNNAELEALSNTLEPANLERSSPTAATESVDQAALSDALSRLDQTALGTMLGRQAALLRPFHFVTEVAIPLIEERARQSGDEGESQPDIHLASMTVRNILGSMLHQYAGGTGARTLLATLAGERRELELLGAAVLSASGGLDAVYLGLEVAAGALVDAVNRSAADVIILGVSQGALRDRAVRDLSGVARRLSADVEIWLLGSAAASIADQVGARVQALQSFSDLRAHLARVGARLA